MDKNERKILDAIDKILVKRVEEVKKERMKLDDGDWVEKSYLVGKEVGLQDAIIEINQLIIDKLLRKRK